MRKEEENEKMKDHRSPELAELFRLKDGKHCQRRNFKDASCPQAICTTSAGATSSLTLVGVGKYPFLAASTTAVDFGEVLSGSTVEHEIILTNTALVAASFEVRGVNGGGEERGIRVTPARGRLQPNGRIALRVS